MKTVGIFGGTFDPPHNGHIKALKAFKNAYNFDEILVIPTASPPHKAACETSAEDRLEMVRLAFSGISVVSVCEFEIASGGKSYTVNTLRYLKEKYNDARFVLFTGSDMLLSLDRWYKADEIMKTAAIACFSRTGGDFPLLAKKAEELREKFGADCEIHNFEPLAVSSSEIRDKALLGYDFSGYLPEKVYDYIKKDCLYKPLTRLYLEKFLHERLSEKRFLHSLGVADSAVTLAEKYGANVKKAEIAGLLHDVTKNMSSTEQIEFAEKNNILLDETERNAPQVIHAKTAEFFVKSTFGLSDGEILGAIRYHTTGRAGGMTLLEKIIYVADFIEPERDYSDVGYYRDLADKNLDDALFEGMCWILSDKLAKRKTIHPDSINMYNDYINFMSRKDKQQ